MKYYSQALKVSAWRSVSLLVIVFFSLLISEKSLAADEVFAANASVVALKAKHTELSKQLENNQYDRPLLCGSGLSILNFQFGTQQANALVRCDDTQPQCQVLQYGK